MPIDKNIPSFVSGEVLKADKLEKLRRTEASLIEIVEAQSKSIGEALTGKSLNGVPLVIGEQVSGRPGVFTAQPYTPPIKAGLKGALSLEHTGSGSRTADGDPSYTAIVWDLGAIGQRFGHHFGYDESGKPILLMDGDSIVVVKLTANRTDGGEYDGIIGTGKMTSTSGDLAMPEGYTFGTAANAIVYNPPETGTHKHRIKVTDEQQRYRLGKVTGIVTAEGADKGKRIVVLDSAMPVVEFLVVDHIYPCSMTVTGHVGTESADSTSVALLYPAGVHRHLRINFSVGASIAFVRIPAVEFGADGIAIQPDIGGVDFTWDTEASAPQNINGLAGIEWANKQTVDGVDRDDFDIEASNGGDLGLEVVDHLCDSSPRIAYLGWNGVDVDWNVPGVGAHGIVGGIRKFYFDTSYTSGDDPTVSANVVFDVDTSGAKTAKVSGVAKVRYQEKQRIIPESLTGVINEDCTVTISYETETVKEMI